MEGFKDSASRLEKSKVTLENLKELQLGLNKNLVIAQEGFIDKIADAITFAFDTEVKVLNKVKAASATYDSKGPSDKNIDSPKWGRHLFGGHGSVYAGKDAEAALTSIEKVVSDTKLKQDVIALGKCLEALTKEVRGNWFVSNEADIKRITNIHKEILETRDTILQLTGKAKETKAVTFVPLSIIDKKKITNSIIAILSETELKKEISKFTSKSGSLYLWTMWQRQFRLKPIIHMTAEDISKANMAAKDARETIKAIKDILDIRVKFGTGIAGYIEASAA